MKYLRLQRSGLALTIVGVALLLVTPLAWWATKDVPDVGDLPVVASTTSFPTVAPSIATSEQTTPRLDLPRRSGLLSRQDDIPATPLPKRLRISAISVDADVVAVGIDPSGAMEIPTDVDQVGGYRFGPAPGEPGTAVLAGHVDSAPRGAEPSSICNVSPSATSWSSRRTPPHPHGRSSPAGSTART